MERSNEERLQMENELHEQARKFDLTLEDLTQKAEQKALLSNINKMVLRILQAAKEGNKLGEEGFRNLLDGYLNEAENLPQVLKDKVSEILKPISD